MILFFIGEWSNMLSNWSNRISQITIRSYLVIEWCFKIERKAKIWWRRRWQPFLKCHKWVLPRRFLNKFWPNYFFWLGLSFERVKSLYKWCLIFIIFSNQNSHSGANGFHTYIHIVTNITYSMKTISPRMGILVRKYYKNLNSKSISFDPFKWKAKSKEVVWAKIYSKIVLVRPTYDHLKMAPIFFFTKFLFFVQF